MGIENRFALSMRGKAAGVRRRAGVLFEGAGLRTGFWGRLAFF
jgi:hypothetical protein